MDNSLVTHLQGYYNALFADIAVWYSDKRECERDRTRLLSLLQAHGSRVATMDLPLVGKHFEQCLEVGYIIPSNHFLSRKRKGTCLPIFMGNLYARLFDPSGVLRSDLDSGVVFAIRQVTLSCKKMRITCESKYTFAEVSNFFSIEEEIQEPTFPWGSDSLDLPDFIRNHLSDDFDDSRLSVHGREAVSRFQRISDIVSSQLGDLSIEKPSELPKHGPGVVSNLRRKESKYSFPEWPEKLDRVFPADTYAGVHHGLQASGRDESVHGWRNESPSKLIAVPKTQKGPRLIAAEPVQNQWIQQLIMNQLVGRLPSTSIRSSVNFRSQVPNQIKARVGSFDGTLCTIDLSSASDRLSCKLVERVFRSNHTLLERLNAARTGTLSNRIDKSSPDMIRLKKFAAQGSACTFVVQSIVYALMAIAVCHPTSRVSSSSIKLTSRQVQVFGDDIIVPSDRFELMSELLAHFGLKVNSSKSFYRGRFRESCGGDYFDGECVTPAYLLEPNSSALASTLPSHIEVSNNFFRKGLWNVSSYLEQSFANFRHLMPVKGVREGTNPSSLASFTGSSLVGLKKRYNHDLHREEYRVLRLVSKPNEVETDGLYQLMKYLHEPSSSEIQFRPRRRVREPITRTLNTVDRGTSLARPGWTPEYYI